MVTIPSKLSTDLWKTISNSYGATIRTKVLWFFSNRVALVILPDGQRKMAPAQYFLCVDR